MKVVKAIGIQPTQPLMVFLTEASLDEKFAPYCFCTLNGRLSKEHLINAVAIDFKAVIRGKNSDGTEQHSLSDLLIVPLDQVLQLHLDQDKEGLAQYLDKKHQTIKVQIQRAILEQLNDDNHLSDIEEEALIEWRDNTLIAKKDYSVALTEPEGLVQEYNAIYCSLVVAEFCADTWLDWVTKATAIESVESETGESSESEADMVEKAQHEKINLNVGDIVFLKTSEGIRKIKITSFANDPESSHGSKLPTCVGFDELDEFDTPIAPNCTWVNDDGRCLHGELILTKI